MSKLPSPEELQNAWIEVQQLHKEYLSRHGVVIPDAEHYSDKSKAVWLSVLQFFKDEQVHKDTISQVVQRDMKGMGADQQVRHLKRDGWEIGDRPGKHQLDPYKPSMVFLNAATRKQVRLSGRNFDEIKVNFGSRCATCGAREDQPDPRYGEEKVKLQQGHRDPDRAGDDIKNIIPQCQFCNRSYRGDFVFDDKGRVRAVAGINPVKRSSRVVQKRIFDWLRKKF